MFPSGTVVVLLVTIAGFVTLGNSVVLLAAAQGGTRRRGNKYLLYHGAARWNRWHSNGTARKRSGAVASQ